VETTRSEAVRLSGGSRKWGEASDCPERVGGEVWREGREEEARMIGGKGREGSWTGPWVYMTITRQRSRVHVHLVAQGVSCSCGKASTVQVSSLILAASERRNGWLNSRLT
jgi:hypothetical protein